MSVRRLAGRISAIILGLAFGLAAAEGILLALGRGPDVATVTAEQFEMLQGIFAPNQRLVVRTHPELPYRVEINSLGYRGPEITFRKPEGESRILVAGDSYVYGSFVDDQETLPARLEDELRARCGSVRVMNAGLGGSTIVDQREIIERALPLAPDLVLLVFSENDLADLARPASLWAQFAENRWWKSRPPLSLVMPLLERMALWTLALEARAHLAISNAEAVASPPSGGEVDRVTRNLRERYRNTLVMLRDALAEHGIPLLFAVFPSHHSVNGSPSAEQVQWAAETSSQAGIPTINLLPALRAIGLPAENLFFLPHDGHPRPVAYAEAATVLADHLSSGRSPSLGCH